LVGLLCEAELRGRNLPVSDLFGLESHGDPHSDEFVRRRMNLRLSITRVRRRIVPRSVPDVHGRTDPSRERAPQSPIRRFSTTNPQTLGHGRC
jgi:hypothetical protein